MSSASISGSIYQVHKIYPLSRRFDVIYWKLGFLISQQGHLQWCCTYIKMCLIKKSNFFAMIEPVGAKAPTFSTELKSSTFQKRIGHSFGMLCQAQAYPVPLIRFVLCRLDLPWL